MSLLVKLNHVLTSAAKKWCKIRFLCVFVREMKCVHVHMSRKVMCVLWIPHVYLLFLGGRPLKHQLTHGGTQVLRVWSQTWSHGPDMQHMYRLTCWTQPVTKHYQMSSFSPQVQTVRLLQCLRALLALKYFPLFKCMCNYLIAVWEYCCCQNIFLFCVCKRDKEKERCLL